MNNPESEVDTGDKDIDLALVIDDLGMSSEEYSSLSVASDDYRSRSTDDHFTKGEVDRFSENAVFGYQSFLNQLPNPKIQQDPSSPTIGEVSEDLINDSNLIPGFTLIKRFGPMQQDSTSLFSGFRSVSKEVPTSNVVLRSTAAPLEANDKVIIRLSPNLTKTFSVTRLLNEWYLLSALNPPKHHRPYTNPRLANAYLEASEKVYDREDMKSSLPVTFPVGVPGILYPSYVVTINNEMEEEPVSLGPENKEVINDLQFAETESTSQKRFALIYKDNDYVTLSQWYNDGSHLGVPSVIAGLAGNVRSNSRNSSVYSSNSYASGGSMPQKLTPQAVAASSSGITHKSAERVVGIIDDMMAVLRTMQTSHELNIVHNGINPNAILKSQSDPSDIKITGWDFSFVIQPENCTNGYRKRHLAQTADLLPYVSPEYAIDSSESVDYRSDIYSLGIVLYELLLDSVPFSDENPYKMLRMVITQTPVAPSAAAPWVSSALSSVVMKCLEKDPRMRYNDCESVIRDLASARNSYVGIGTPKISQFINIDRCGVPLTLTPPRGLFGHHEIARDIIKDYNDAKPGVSVYFITGSSGSGKSTLLKSLHSMCIDLSDFQVMHRMSIGTTGIMYQAAISVMREVVSKVIAAGSDNQTYWRRKLIEQVDVDLSFMFDLIPELKQLMGSCRPRRDVSEDHPHSTRDDSGLNTELRFRHALKLLFMVFSCHGITLFADDGDVVEPILHGFILEIFSAVNEYSKITCPTASIRCFIVSSAFEQKGISTEEQLESYRKLGVALHHYEVGEVSESAFEEYLAGWLGSDVTRYTFDSPIAPRPVTSLSPSQYELSHHMFQHTGGNLLFAHYLMANAVVCSRIRYDLCNSPDSRWQPDIDWSPKSVEEAVATYLSNSMGPQSEELLKMAVISRRGNCFHMSDLLVGSNMSISQCYAVLKKLEESRVIIPESTYYKIPFHVMASDEFPFDITDASVWELAKKNKYSFFHESIAGHIEQEMRKSGEWSKLHRQCGLRFYKRMSKSTQITMSEYLIMALHMFHSLCEARPDDRKIFVEVLIKGGKYMSSVGNLLFGIRFFEAASSLISEKRLKTKIFLTICQNLYHLGAYQKCLELIDRVTNDYAIDESIFLLARVRCLIYSGNKSQGLELAISGLKRLGMGLTINEGKAESNYHRMMQKVSTSVVDIRAMRNLPVTTNPVVLLAYELFGDAISVTYRCRKQFVRLQLIAQAILLMHSHGVSPYCGTVLLAYANYLCDLRQAQFVQGIEWGRLALKVVGRGDSVPLSYVQGFYENYVHTLAAFNEPVGEVRKRYALYTAATTAAPNYAGSLEGIRGLVRLYMTVFNNSLGGDDNLDQVVISQLDPVQVKSLDLFQGKISLDEFSQVEHPEMEVDYRFCVFCSKLYALSAELRYREAADAIFEYLDDDLCLPVTAMHLEVYAMIYTTFSRFLPRSKKEESRAKTVCNEIWSYFVGLAELNGSNYRPQLLYLVAIRASIDEECDKLDVLDKFDDAIHVSLEHDNYYVVGWLAYLCGTWLINQSGWIKRIVRYLKLALESFQKTKFNLLVGVLERKLRDVVNDTNITGITSVSRTDINDAFHGLSLTQANEGKLEPPQVILGGPANDNSVIDHVNEAIVSLLAIAAAGDANSIAEVLVSNASNYCGASYGVVIFKKGDDMAVMASYQNSQLEVFREEPVSSRRDVVPYSLVQHVANSGVSIASNDDPVFFTRFASDDYYRSEIPSVICEPLISQSGVIGILYLERPNSKEKMTDRRNRANLVKLLAMQAAVSFTKARLYQETAKAKQAAEDATAEKASFLSNMSHEIRTPFNSLLSCSLFLLDTELTPTQHEYVNTIKQSAMVTLNIIDGILAFSKMEHGSFSLDVAPFSLNDCIESAIQLSGEQAAANQVELAFYNKCPEIDTIDGDVTRFRQIIINLVGNAVKFTSEGQVVITCTASLIMGSRYQISISVADSGIGIPENSRNKVFGAFSQVDGSLRRVFGGSGLGLAISKKLVEIMGGSLTFESTEGEGSTFYFTISASANLQEKQPVVAWPQSWEKPEALVIDKQCYIRGGLVSILEWTGLKVTGVSSLVQHHGNLGTNYQVVFVAAVQFSSTQPWLRKLLPNARVVVVTPFGMPLDPDMSKQFLILCPFLRVKVVDVLNCIVANHNNKVSKPVLSITTPASNNVSIGSKYPLRLLLAEDNIVNTRVALTHLRRFGYNADHAKDGVEVLEMCQKLYDNGEPMYQVILMDIQMPRMDGIATTIELRKRLLDRNMEHLIPSVVALTANVAGEEKQRSAECGMVGFVTKPILPQDFGRLLEKLGKEISQK